MPFPHPGRYYYGDAAPIYEDNTVFKKFCVAEVPFDGECFLPTVGLTNSMSEVCSWLGTISYPIEPLKLAIPLYVQGAESKRTADAMIQDMSRCPVKNRLIKVTSSKGLDFYGGSGLILDEHMNPMLVFGFKVKINRLERKMIFLKPMCYVSPSVFSSEDLISKAIVKKVIPFYTSTYLPSNLVHERNIEVNQEGFRNTPVIIQPLDQFFTEPTKPKDIESLNRDIWEFLSRNMDDLK